MPLFWAFGYIYPGSQNKRVSPFSYASLPVRNGFHRFTSGVIPAGLLVAIWQLSHYDSHACTHASIGVAQIRDRPCHFLT